MSLLEGTLVRAIGGFYTVRDREKVEYVLRCKKKFRHIGMTPLPGDEVLFTPGSGEEHGWLEEILPRKTVFLRPPVANVECLILVEAPEPEPDLLLADRLLSRVLCQGVNVILVVNKADLDPQLGARLRAEYTPAGIPVLTVSARTGEGLTNLRAAMEGKLCCLAGQSGVGKSSLLNALMDLHLDTGALSLKIGRGKNTTRHVELLEKDRLRVMDTAGFSLLETEKNLAPEKLKERYPEFRSHEDRCKFHECLHDREPGCAVAAAAMDGSIHPERLKRYRQLLSELRETWQERYS